MKKVMIALAALSLAGAAQAEAWFAVQSRSDDGRGTLYNGKGTTTALSNWSVYMLATDTTYDVWETLAKQVVSSFQAGTLSESNITQHGSYGAKLTTDDNGGFGDYQKFKLENGQEFQQNAFLAVAFNGDAMYVNDYIYEMGKSYDEAGPDDFGYGVMNISFWKSADVPSSGSYDGFGWYTAAVPEPTSGLLMLVGMAGLALRRKRR